AKSRSFGKVKSARGRFRERFFLVSRSLCEAWHWKPILHGYRCSIAVALRKFLVPFPSALDNAIERLKLRLPAKLALDFLRGSDQPRGVAEPEGLFGSVVLSTGDFSAYW